MAASLNDKIIIAISSRALFDLDDSNTMFEEKGLDEYIKYQIEHENETLKRGVAFSLIKKLLDIRYPHNNEGIFEVILVSRNDANTGLRVSNAIEHYGLDKTPILEQFKPHIFFDDQMAYCGPASKVVPTGHVPAGIANL